MHRNSIEDERLFSLLVTLLGFRRIYAGHTLTLGSPLELHLTIDEGVEGKVPSHANVTAWPNTGTALPHDDVTSYNSLPTKLLHPQTLSGAITAVAGATTCLFVGH